MIPKHEAVTWTWILCLKSLSPRLLPMAHFPPRSLVEGPWDLGQDIDHMIHKYSPDLAHHRKKMKNQMHLKFQGMEAQGQEQIHWMTLINLLRNLEMPGNMAYKKKSRILLVFLENETSSSDLMMWVILVCFLGISFSPWFSWPHDLTVKDDKSGKCPGVEGVQVNEPQLGALSGRCAPMAKTYLRKMTLHGERPVRFGKMNFELAVYLLTSRCCLCWDEWSKIPSWSCW